MQGALFGARSLGTGFGPILFATIFSLFSRTDSPFPFFPGTAAVHLATQKVAAQQARGAVQMARTDEHIVANCCPYEVFGHSSCEVGRDKLEAM